MDYNYHTHTYFCRHASETPEEYVKTAIQGGIKFMGFSEHFPLLLDDETQSNYRLLLQDKEDYFSQINELKYKYQEKINIKVGFEMEYYPQDFEKMYKNAKEYGAEYLIVGEHFYCAEDREDGIYVALPTEDENILKRYTKAVVEAIKTGVFTYVAHPDIIYFEGDEKLLEDSFRKICVASREYGTPLEINFLGIRRQRHYPNKLFWQVAGQEKSPVIFGFDAHAAVDACDKNSLNTALEYVEKFNLNYIGKPTLKPLV